MAVKSSRVAFTVLKEIARALQPLGAADIARRLSLPITTAARALGTLEAAGYTQRHKGSARFVLGPAGQRLAYAFMARFPIRDVALPYLQQLTLLSGHSASLFVRLGWYSVRIALIAGTGSIVNVGAIGEAWPLTIGAPALAILAQLPERDFLRAVVRHGAEPSPLRERRDRIRRQGYASDLSRIEGGGYDLALPLSMHPSGLPAAVALEGMAAGPNEARDAVQQARRTVAPLQDIITHDPGRLTSPYAHIDPDEIRLG